MMSFGVVDSLRLVIEIFRDQKEHLWPTSQGEARVEAGALKPSNKLQLARSGRPHLLAQSGVSCDSEKCGNWAWQCGDWPGQTPRPVEIDSC
jgi:hypothetical protein